MRAEAEQGDQLVTYGGGLVIVVVMVEVGRCGQFQNSFSLWSQEEMSRDGSGKEASREAWC